MSSKGVDLGMLEALVVLIEEQHVSRAAKRLSVSQSALSYTLGRLRDVFDDPILVRTGKGMVPTERALGLIDALSGPISTIAETLDRDAKFDPATANVNLRIAASGFATTVLLPRLMRELLAEAPNCRVEVLPTTRIATWNQLEMGKVDIALGYWPDPSNNLIVKALLKEQLCLISAPETGYGDEISLEEISQAKFFGYTTGEGQLVNYERAFDASLKLHNIARHIVMRGSSIQAIPDILAMAKLVAVVPRRAAARAIQTHPIRVLKCPLDMPKIPLQAIWHQRTHRADAHIWMRRILDRVAREIR